MKKNLLVTLADKNYIDYAKQLFSSAYFNAGWKGDYLLLAHEVPEDKLKWFRKKGILVYECPEIKLQGKIPGKWPIVVLDKFYLLKPYFKKWQTVIFLDSDIIVRSSLEKLTKVKGFSAVLGHKKLSELFLGKVYIFLEKIDKSLLEKISEKHNMSRPVFNSGVLVFNTDIIKKNSFQKLIELQKKYGPISAAGDEAAFNLYFQEWNMLPFIYNVYPDYLLAATFIKPSDIKGIILHFVLKKPWNKKHPFHNEWLANFNRADEIKKISNILPAKIMPAAEINNYDKFVKANTIKGLAKRLCFNAYMEFDRFVGMNGLILKRLWPNLYYHLKKYIHKQKGPKNDQ